MRTKIIVCRVCFFMTLSILSSIFGIVSNAWADLYGMVIGIDKYNVPGLDSLDGAVNDAKDINDALKIAGAKEIKLLLDQDASRDNIMKSWDELLNKSREGDVLVFTYAGHGSREAEHVKGSEASGKDSVFVLGGFNWEGPNTYERIIDDEVGGMLKKATDKKRYVILIADSCHSGTMTRGQKPLVKHKTRYGTYPTIKDEHLPPIDPKLSQINLDENSDLLYIGAVQDTEQSPEINIGDKTRGALSWAFARALRGAADKSGHGTVSGDELKEYVVETVRMQTEGAQHPSIPGKARGGIQVPVGTIKDKTAASLAAANTPPLLRFAILHSKNTPASLIEKLKGVILVAQSPVEPPAAAPVTRGRGRNDEPASADGAGGAQTGQAADLVWDMNDRVVRNILGDTAAHMGQPAPTSDQPITRGRGRPEDATSAGGAEDEFAKLPHIQKIIDKWRTVETIKQLSEGNSLTFSLRPHDGVHPLGAKISYIIHGHDKTFFTLFNLASDGTVNFLYPLATAKIKDPLEIPLGKPYNLTLTAEPPLGADHVVAIASAAPLTGLHQALKQLDGKLEAETVLGLLHTHLAGQTYKMGVHGSYTGEK